jgi:UDP-galactopyranose mutase
VYHAPPFAPVTGLAGARTVADGLRRHLLRRAARRLALEQPIVWIARPDVAGLASVFAAQLTIYHVVDEYSGYPGMSAAARARQREAELPLLRRADLVIVTSQALFEAKRQHNPRTFLVPNGVDLPGYERHLARGAPVPPELAGIPRPRLGVIGLIGPKLDFDLLQAAASARPDWSFAFLGAVSAGGAASGWTHLAAQPNVFYLGQVPADRVPEYVCGFDVGLMPYIRTGHLPYCDPLRLYDYLAGGIPVASVDQPWLDGYRAAVHTGDGPGPFLKAIEAALSDRDAERVAMRRQLAARCSWDQRIEAISSLILTHPNRNRQPGAASGPDGAPKGVVADAVPLAEGQGCGPPP